MVKEHGITLAELFPPVRRNSSPRKDVRKRGDQTMKYRNPEIPSQTWTGNGRKPGWLVEALTSGKTLEDFEIYGKANPQTWPTFTLCIPQSRVLLMDF
jgi:DNA-binding protein H-NS